MFKRILVPLDGSENAKKVIPIVVTEAKCHNAVVVLLRVIAPLRQSLMTSPNLITKIFKELECNRSQVSQCCCCFAARYRSLAAIVND